MSKYKPEFHPQEIIKLRDNGLSKAEVCRTFEISTTACDDWRNKYPEFNEAYKVAHTYALAWWFGEARRCLIEKHFNEGLFKFIFQAMFKEFRDSPPIKLPKIDSKSSLRDMGYAILRSMQTGEYSVEQIVSITGVITKMAEVFDYAEIKDNVDEIRSDQG